MKKIVRIEWGTNVPWNDNNAEALEIRQFYLESKFLAGLTTSVDGTPSDDLTVVTREWADQSAAEEEVAYVTTFAQTHGLDLISIEILDSI
jgi:hypothetical protein